MSPSATPPVGGLDELRDPGDKPESLDNLRDRVNGESLPPVRPQWTNPAIPPDRRLSTFLEDHSKELRPWEDVEKNFHVYFPGGDPKPLKDIYERSAKLEGWRTGAKQQISEQDWGYFLNRNFAPFASPLIRLADSIAYTHARDRFVAGQSTDDDMKNMAFHERMKELESGRSGGAQAAVALGHVVPLVLESIIGGHLLKGLGIGAEGTTPAIMSAEAAAPALSREALKAGLQAAPGYIGRTAAQTVVMPSMYLAQAGERSEAQGGEFYSPKNLGPAYALGFAQVAVLHGLGKIPTGIAGTDAAAYLGRVGVRAAIGTAGQTGIIDPGASLISEALPEAYKLETGYGALGDLARGNGDKALQRLAITAITFAAFSALHGGPDEMRSGAPKELVAKMKEMADQGIPANVAGTRLNAAVDHLMSGLEKNPDMTRSQAEAMFDGWPDGSIRDFGLAMAKSLPEKPPTTPTPPPEPPNAQPQGPTPPQQGPQAGTQPAAPPSPPQPAPPPSLPPDEATVRDTAAWLGLKKTGSVEDVLARVLKHPQGQMMLDAAAGKSPTQAQPQKPATFEPPLARELGKMSDEQLTQALDDLEQLVQEKRATTGEKEQYAALKAEIDRRSNTPEAVARNKHLDAFLAHEQSEQGTLQNLRNLRPEPPDVADEKDPEPPPEKRESDLQAAVKKWMGGLKINHDEVFDAAGLTAKQKHVMRELEWGREFGEIAEDPEMHFKGRPVRKQAVDYHFKEALKKLGITREEYNQYFDGQKNNAMLDRVERQGKDGLAQGELNDQTAGVISRRADFLTKLDGRMETLANKFIAESEKGDLSPERSQFYEDEFARLDQLRKGRLETEGQEPEASQPLGKQPTPVRRAGTGSVQEGDQAPDVAPAQPPTGRGAEDAGESRSAAPVAERGEARRNELIQSEVARLRAEAKRNGVKLLKPGDADYDDASERQIDPAYRDPEAIYQSAMEVRPHTEAPDEVAEVQAADKAAGLSHAATEEGIASANAEAQRLASEEHASRGNVQPGTAAEQPAEPTGQPGATGDAGADRGLSPGVMGKALKLAQDFAADEGGYLDLNKMHELAARFYEKLKAGTQYVGDNLKELSGQMFPRTTRESKPAGEALARLAAVKTFVKTAVPHYIDEVIGKKATPEQDSLLGTTFYEERFRHAIEANRQEAAKASTAAAAARSRAQTATDPTVKRIALEEAAAASKRATEMMQAANDVQTFVGKTDSPLADEATYQQSLNSPEYKAFSQRWAKFADEQVTPNYRGAMGLDETDPIDSLTQLPGRPMNAKAIRSEEDAGPGTIFVGSRGNLKNLKIPKYGFAEKATLAADAYDTRASALIENTMQRGYASAKKAEFYRTAVEEGTGVWARPGQQIEGFKEIPFTKPPTGTQQAEGNEVFYASEATYGETRQALSVDLPTRLPIVNSAAGLLTRAALASTVEAAYHSKNLLTFMMKPGISPVDFIRNAYGKITGDPALSTKLVELARIGALKEPGFEKQGETVLGSKYNPLTWMGRFLDVTGDVMRLTANDAFDRIQRRGYDVPDTETNRRDFINQLGQYNRLGQNKAIVLLRDLGLGPFATAGSNYYMQGLKSLVGGHGLETGSYRADVQLRAEMLAKTGAILGAVALTNYLAWGNILGDDKTPLGAVKIGEKDGKTSYFDLTALIGLTRGARQTGLLALAEGTRKGQGEGKIEDKVMHDVLAGLLHPALGPPVAFGWTAATGKNTLGQTIAPQVSTATTPEGRRQAAALGKPPEGSSQSWQNVKTALLNANPVVATATGADQPPGSEKRDVSEKIGHLLGPYGIKTRGDPKARKRMGLK